MSDEECSYAYTAPSRAHSISPRCVGRVWNETMFSLAHALFSPGSAEDCSSLFVWCSDTRARSDSSRACASAWWLCAFADRPGSLAGRGAPEVSRFSCLLFLRRARGLRLRRTDGSLAFIANHRGAFLHQERVGILVLCFSKLNTRPTDTPVYASSDNSRCHLQD